MKAHMLEKRCKGCGDWKNLEEFSPHNRTKDGLQPSCKSCRNKKSRERYAKKGHVYQHPPHTGLTLRRRMELEEIAKTMPK